VRVQEVWRSRSPRPIPEIVPLKNNFFGGHGSIYFGCWCRRHPDRNKRNQQFLPVSQFQVGSI
jgi:hypothetical protein